MVLYINTITQYVQDASIHSLGTNIFFGMSQTYLYTYRTYRMMRVIINKDKCRKILCSRLGLLARFTVLTAGKKV